MIKKILFLFLLMLAGSLLFSPPFRTSFSQEGGLTRTTGDNVAAIAPSRVDEGQSILRLLGDLRRLVLDDSIFFDPAFTNLVDHSFPLDPEPRGRPNPFAPVGREIPIFNPGVRNLEGVSTETFLEFGTTTSEEGGTVNEIIVMPIMPIGL